MSEKPKTEEEFNRKYEYKPTGVHFFIVKGYGNYDSVFSYCDKTCDTLSKFENCVRKYGYKQKT